MLLAVISPRRLEVLKTLRLLHLCSDPPSPAAGSSSVPVRTRDPFLLFAIFSILCYFF